MTIKRTTRWGGDAGAIQTLHRMQKQVNLSIVAPLVMAAAHGIVEDIAERDTVAQAWAVRDFLSRSLHFIPDPVNIEVLETPESMLKTIAARGFAMGDCDNAAMLSAALLKAIGIRCRFVILGFLRPGAPFQHVYTEAFTPRGWVDMDTTGPAGARPLITRRFMLEV